VQPFFVAFDTAIAALSLRSIAALGRRAPWTSAGWAGTIGWALASIVEFSAPSVHAVAAAVAYGFVVVLAIAFAVAGVRDEPQAEPWWWPTHAGETRAEKRADLTGR
jgi:hypothetical protein